MIDLEEAVIKDKGCWLTLMKVPQTEPVADDKGAAGAKKAAPKKGGQSADEMKPTFGRAWLDLSELSRPGATYMTKRVFLETIPPATKETTEQGEVWVDQEEFEQVFEPQRTYVNLEINLSEPVVP